MIDLQFLKILEQCLKNFHTKKEKKQHLKKVEYSICELIIKKSKKQPCNETYSIKELEIQLKTTQILKKVL